MHKYILIKCVFVGLRPSGHFTDLKATKYINGPLIFPSPLLNVLIVYGKSRISVQRIGWRSSWVKGKVFSFAPLWTSIWKSLRGSKKRENIKWLISLVFANIDQSNGVHWKWTIHVKAVERFLFKLLNVVRMANAVHFHSLLSGIYDCHDLRFSIVFMLTIVY